MPTNYTIEVNERGLIIQGAIPVSDMKAINALGKAHGFNIIDASISTALRATMVITNKANSEKWRAEINSNIAATVKDPEEAWLRGTDTGMSSVTMFSMMTDNNSLRMQAYGRTNAIPSLPLDADDIGRCVRMVRTLGFHNRLERVEVLGNDWLRLVRAWDHIERTYDLQFTGSARNDATKRLNALVQGSK